MVDKFQYITHDGIFLSINLGIKAIIFEGNEDEDISNYYGSRTKGLSWLYDDKQVKIMEEGFKIQGYPSTDLQKVIVIYPMNHGTYPAPNNAVIHNADGSVYMQLSPPELISDLAKQQQERDPKGPFMVYFENVSWGYDSNSNTVVAISIGYNWNWREQRALNPETGEFGECLSSGMR
jgi:hypothetical protein